MAKQSKIDAEKSKAEAHKAKLAEIKAKRREEVVLERSEPILEEKPTILIYCEGKNTEPSYFKQFKIQTASVKVFGEGRNTLSLVKHAHKIVKDYKKNGKPFEQVWCVFDADPKPDNPKQLIYFNQAIALAKKHGYNVAYSNQAFEYWLILHFEDHQGGAMERSDYDSKLNSYLKAHNLTYEGTSNKIVTPEIFNLLFEHMGSDKDGKPLPTRTDLAIKRAKIIYNRHDHSNPAKEESSTTVFNLLTLRRFNPENSVKLLEVLIIF